MDRKLGADALFAHCRRPDQATGAHALFDRQASGTGVFPMQPLSDAAAAQPQMMRVTRPFTMVSVARSSR